MIQPSQPIVVAPEQPGRGAVVFHGVDATGPSAVYEGFRAQRRVLADQLEELESTRETITRNLLQVSATDPERKVLEGRLAEIDKGISTVDGMLAANATQIAQAAAVPGAVVEPPPQIRQGPDDEVFIVATIFMVIVLFPLSVALARRIWRKSVTAVTSFPRELSDRLARMENALEATSLEVERIGEGQRFLTRLFAEKEATLAIAPGAGAAAGGTHLLERKPTERLP